LTFLILSGPTREYLDPVRFISNESSGKMGTALAKQALKKGAKVIFISGPAPVKPERKLSKKLKIIDVVSAGEMFAALKKNFKKADIVIGAAAVSDFKPVSLKKQKIKKGSGRTAITFDKNPDIIAYCGKNKKKQVVAGFALETEKLLKNAAKKLKEKNLDMIVANGRQSLGSDKTTVYLITNNMDSVSAVSFRRKPESILSVSSNKLKGNVDTGFRRYDNLGFSKKQGSKNKIAGKIIDETIGIFKRIKAC